MSLNNPVCMRFNDLLKRAMAAVHRLDCHGVCIRSINLQGSKPVIEIDPPPAHAFLQGALRRRERVQNTFRTVMATAFHDCQVEWEITTHAACPVAEVSRG